MPENRWRQPGGRIITDLRLCWVLQFVLHFIYNSKSVYGMNERNGRLASAISMEDI